MVALNGCNVPFLSISEFGYFNGLNGKVIFADGTVGTGMCISYFAAATFIKFSKKMLSLHKHLVLQNFFSLETHLV